MWLSHDKRHRKPPPLTCALAVTSCCDAKSSGLFSVSLPSLQPCYQPRAAPPAAGCCKQALNWSLAKGMVSLGQLSHWEWEGTAHKGGGHGMDLRARPWLAASRHMPCKCTDTEADATPSYFLQCLPEMGRWVLSGDAGPRAPASVSLQSWSGCLPLTRPKDMGCPNTSKQLPHKSSPASIKRSC